jgi:hypothetical protein
MDSFKKLCNAESCEAQSALMGSWLKVPNPPLTFQASAACDEVARLARVTKHKVTSGSLLALETCFLIFFFHDLPK